MIIESYHVDMTGLAIRSANRDYQGAS